MAKFMRWVLVLSLTVVSTISYIDRYTLALLAPTMLRETHLTNQQYGFIISAFSVTYMLGNPIWGRILDRIGVSLGMAVAVTMWTLASVSHAFARGFMGFAVARALLGVGEAATFPGCLRTVVQALPLRLRSRGVAVAYSGGSIGAFLTPLVITPIAAAWGWRSAFWFTGLLGVVWLASWSRVARDADLGQSPSRADGLKSPKWSDRKLWAFIVADALGSFPQALIIYWASNYLSVALGKQQIEIGKILWVPPLGWEAGYFFWGWAIDRSSAGGHDIPFFRRRLVTLAVLGLPLALVPRATSSILVLAMMFSAMFVTAGFIICSTAYATTYFRDHAGLIAGLGAGSSSAVVAVTMPILGRLFDLHRYQGAFVVAALLPAIGVAGWVLLNQTTLKDITGRA